MASRGWLPPRVSRLRNVAGATGLAAGCLLVLLLCAGRGMPALSAEAGAGEAAVSVHPWTERGDVSGAWTSLQPTSTVVGPSRYVWEIDDHGIVITFHTNSVSFPAWFTFTPRISSALPGVYLPTPYFFDLNGVYQINDERVSLDYDGIEITLAYDPSRLSKIELDSLRFFHFGTTDWVLQGGEVNHGTRTVSLSTKRTESFAVGGKPRMTHKTYLSLVMRD
jgi:hypothetical protein